MLLFIEMKLLTSIPVKYALAMCAVVVVCLTMMEITGENKSFDKSIYASFFTFIAPVIIWFLGIREKKLQQKGKLTYKQGVIEGFKIGVAYGILSPFIFLGYYLFFNPQIIASVRTMYQLTNQPDFVVIGADLGIQAVASVLFGTIYGIILSSFLRNK